MVEGLVQSQRQLSQLQTPPPIPLPPPQPPFPHPYSINIPSGGDSPIQYDCEIEELTRELQDKSNVCSTLPTFTTTPGVTRSPFCHQGSRGHRYVTRGHGVTVMARVPDWAKIVPD